ncbi:MAG TPA: murein L,D-transpeptidase catalytic domain family protein [Coxiellaceae bacterium]|nr:MAG: hypothetical protein A3E81_06110 [Gammaproteobacteria bacterium RIFCSPHIGHO2_12_FULL_36_30]HLB56877.1 murein L,D-transpeptidase catalytic domain family protein [Coxiellaceae bacterium]
MFVAAQTSNANYFKAKPAVQHTTPQQKALDGLPDPILKEAINAYRWAWDHHEIHNPYMLTIVDFNKPSYEKRMWVIDLRNNHVIFDMHVAQGRASGKIYATRFSNQFNSHESSLGIFTTVGSEFYGEFGKSIHLTGLEPGINNNAYKRGILVHSEWYVTPSYIDQMGRAGRTWGCFAVNPDHIDRVIELTQDGSVLFAYATPEKNDPLVDHRLSYDGRTMYEKILGINSNPVVRFFEAL